MAKREGKFKINGKEYKLKYGSFLYKLMEDYSGKPFHEFLSEGTMNSTLALFHFGLIGGGKKKITLEESADIFDDFISEVGFDVAMQEISKLVEGSLGKNPSPTKK